MNYETYKLRVLAKTDAANIHGVRGQLAIVMNVLENEQYFRAAGNTEMANKSLEHIRKAKQKIYKLTKVSW